MRKHIQKCSKIIWEVRDLQDQTKAVTVWYDTVSPKRMGTKSADLSSFTNEFTL